jgi:hypothetical protein
MLDAEESQVVSKVVSQTYRTKYVHPRYIDSRKKDPEVDTIPRYGSANQSRFLPTCTLPFALGIRRRSDYLLKGLGGLKKQMPPNNYRIFADRLFGK